MPEHLRALIVILFLAAAVFGFARQAALSAGTDTAAYKLRRNLWFLMTLAAFLSPHFWAFIVVAGGILLLAGTSDRNSLALYFLLLFAVPPFRLEISGMGVLEHLFAMDYLRLLSITVLVPAHLRLRGRADNPGFGRLMPDRFIGGYIFLYFVLQAQADSFTNALRHGVFYAYLDIFLPYYVASRALRSMEDFRDALAAFVLAALILCPVALFEALKHWLLYASLDGALGAKWGYGNYLLRGDSLLRAQASTGQPIVLGFVLAVALGFVLYLRGRLVSRWQRWLAVGALVGALAAALSRGPWVGAAVSVFVFVATGSNALRKIALMVLVSAAAAPILALTPAGRRALDLLPFVGSVEEFNIDYRERLLETAVAEIMQRPFFGGFDPRAAQFQDLVQSQGIIDLVNSYVGIGLTSGLVGLSLFAGFFLVSLASAWRGLARARKLGAEQHVLGRSLVATLAGILVIIFTTSSINVIAVICWAVAGLCVAYSRMVRRPASELSAAPSSIGRGLRLPA